MLVTLSGRQPREFSNDLVNNNDLKCKENLNTGVILSLKSININERNWKEGVSNSVVSVNESKDSDDDFN